VWDGTSTSSRSFYCVDISHRYSPAPIATEKFIDPYVITDSTYSLRNDPSGSKHAIKEEIKATAPFAQVDIVDGGAARNIMEIMQKHIDQFDGDHVPNAEESEGDYLSRTSIGNLLHVTWMLNNVITNGANNATSGGFEDMMMITYRVYLDAKRIGAMARRFPRANFTVGADAANWNSNEELDFYIAAVVMGIAETGRNVASGAHLLKSANDHRYFEGSWHYKHNEVVIEAFINNIRNDVRCRCMSQSGKRVFKKQKRKDEVGIMSLGAADSNGRRIYLHDAYGLGNSGVTSVSPERWSAHHVGLYTPTCTFAFKAWCPTSVVKKIWNNLSKFHGTAPRICDCSNFPFRAEKFEAWKPDPDWLVRKGILESLGGGVIFGEQVLFNFKYVVPVDQVAKWLGRNAVANSFVSRTITANLASSNDKLHATWDATDRTRESPYILKELVDGDHFANRVGIVDLPDVTECAILMIMWPHAVSYEYKFGDIDSMSSELFFPKANDSFSVVENYKVKTRLVENMRPLEDLFADEDDVNSVLKARAFFAQAIGADVNNFD
jgi:hypothetical protein